MSSDSNEKGKTLQNQNQDKVEFTLSTNPVVKTDKLDQYYHGHGKLLLSGEYFVLDGAEALALPTTVGQSLTVRYSPSFNPVLSWKSFDPKGQLWFEAKFEFWRFNLIGSEDTEETKVLQGLLREARKQNPHFLRDEVDVIVETRLGFPLDWGLGSSSTLVFNIAQWAYVSPFELLFKTMRGSGYDIACAQSEGPIIYQKNTSGPKWAPTAFDPSFKDNLWFVYLGHKQNSRAAIAKYRENKSQPEQIARITELTRLMAQAQTLQEFQSALLEHEAILSERLGQKTVKEEKFSDFNGEIKSLGAWGGDFILVSSDMNHENVKSYFNDKGLDVCLPYRELILPPHQMGGHTNGKQNDLVH